MNLESSTNQDQTASYPPAKGTVNSERDSCFLALDRTILANDRTYQAWIRTGLSLFIAGLAALKFLRHEMPFWMLLVIAVLLILFSVLAFILAAWRYRHFRSQTRNLYIDAVPSWVVIITSVALTAGAILALAGLYINTHS